MWMLPISYLRESTGLPTRKWSDFHINFVAGRSSTWLSLRLQSFHPDHFVKISSSWFPAWIQILIKTWKTKHKEVKTDLGGPFPVLLTKCTVEKVKKVGHITSKWETADIIVQRIWTVLVQRKPLTLTFKSLVCYFEHDHNNLLM